MKQLLTLLSFMAFAIDVNAYDFVVANSDGINIYYNYINSGKEVEVTYEGHYKSWNSKTLKYDYYYRGVYAYNKTVIIPETVTYNERTFPVTKIGSHAFEDCSIKSIIFPQSLNSIGYS